VPRATSSSPRSIVSGSWSTSSSTRLSGSGSRVADTTSC
jgi:hypothetical protein